MTSRAWRAALLPTAPASFPLATPKPTSRFVGIIGRPQAHREREPINLALPRCSILIEHLIHQVIIGKDFFSDKKIIGKRMILMQERYHNWRGRLGKLEKSGWPVELLRRERRRIRTRRPRHGQRLGKRFAIDGCQPARGRPYDRTSYIQILSAIFSASLISRPFGKLSSRASGLVKWETGSSPNSGRNGFSLKIVEVAKMNKSS
jgi:hypothetical protein